MKKREGWIIFGILLAVLLAVGIIFCILRPEYVREAMEILFKNELQ